jgi:HD-like signal output (HDOD) protein
VHDLGAFYMLYRGAQYAEVRERPETLKYLILNWHESIGVSLLNALGLPDEIVEAAIDHDQPRAEPMLAVRTLSDVVYAANALAGGTGEWLFELAAGDADSRPALREIFAEVLPAIESETKEMMTVFA